MNEWMNEWVNEWMDEWMSEWVNEWINEWMNEWMNECIITKWETTTEPFDTPFLDRNVAKRRYITLKLFIVISFFFFPLIDNSIKFRYKQRMSHQLKNSSLLLTIDEYCMFHIEGFFLNNFFFTLFQSCHFYKNCAE